MWKLQICLPAAAWGFDGAERSVVLFSCAALPCALVVDAVHAAVHVPWLWMLCTLLSMPAAVLGLLTDSSSL